MIDTPYQFKSLASRVRGMHGALDADELAKLLGVANCAGRNGGRFHRFVSARWFALTLRQSLAGCSNKVCSLCPLRIGLRHGSRTYIVEIRLTTTAVSGNLRFPSVTASRHCRNLTVVSAWKDLASPTRQL